MVSHNRKTPSTVDVSIIIVAYKATEQLLECLDSICKESNPAVNFEVIVIDNNADTVLHDILIKEFPSVRYFANKKNIGFGAGCNQGARHANGPCFFFLNPDTIVATQAVSELYSFLQRTPRGAVVAPTLYNIDGERYPDQGARILTPLRGVFSYSFVHRLWPRNPIADEYFYRESDVSKPYQVEVVPGTAFMIKSDVFWEVGGFDEQFFLYFEESDLCRRVVSLGYQLWIIPQAKITHHWQASTGGVGTIKHFEESRQRYFKKYYGWLQAFILELLFRLGKRELIVLIAIILTIMLCLS